MVIDLRLAAYLCLLLIPPLAGCGSSQPSEGAPATQLTMRAVNTSVGRAVFHLDCEPPGGDLPDPLRACAALAERPDLVTSPKPFTCFGGTFSWWDITISGRLNGEAIDHAFSTCWTPQMDTLGRFGMSWDVLQNHLLPRRHEEVLPETTRVFAPGVLEAADLVTCDIRGHHLDIGVPVDTGPGGSVGYNGANVVSVTLTLGRHADGSVEASCHTGDP
jgi:hypothetical protein